MCADLNTSPFSVGSRMTAIRVAGVSGIAAALVFAAAAGLAMIGGTSSAQGAPPRLDVTMGHHILKWQALPGDRFTVRLSNPSAITERDPEGEKAFVEVGADGTGAVEVKLRARTNAFAYKAIEPGDRLEIATYLGPTLLDFIVPTFGADADDDGMLISGSAPAGSTVTITLESDDTRPPFSAIVSADSDGRFVLDLPADQRLAEGEGGMAVFVDGDGHRYTSIFARRHVVLEVGGTRIDTRSSLQAPVGAWRMAAVSGSFRRRGFSVNVVRSVGMTSDGRLSYYDDYPYLLSPGTVVTISQTSALLGLDDLWPRALPDLAISFDGAGVEGRAPAGASLEISVHAPDVGLPAVHLSATANASGTFAVLLPGDIRPDAGTRAEVRLDTGDGIWLRAQSVLPRIDASVDAAHVGIEMQPLSPVTLTLRSGTDATVSYQGAHRADAFGRVDVQLDSGEVHPGRGWNIFTPLRPGDQLAVEWDHLDPQVFVIPTLKARSDADAEAITGVAPPFDTLEINLVETGATLHRTVAVDADGTWRLDLAGDGDLEPDVYARVAVLDRGHHFYTYTAPRSIKIHTERADAETAPYIGYPMAMTLTTSDGRVAATGSWPLQDLAAPAIGTYGYEFGFDRFATGVRVRPGDTVEVQVGNDFGSMVVPQFDARVHVGDDLILGRTIPGGRVRLETSYESLLDTPTVDIVADVSGAYRHSFSGVFDIAFNDRIYATLDLGRHLLAHAIAAPGLTFDLSAAVLDGTIEPEVAVSVRVGAPPLLAGTGSAVADRRAEFTIALVGPEGRPAVPLVGQPVVVEAPAATMHPRLDWRVPLLEIHAGDEGSVTGQVEPGSAVRVQRGFSRLNRDGRSEWSDARVAGDGSFDARFESTARGPGLTTRVYAELPDGHQAVRREAVPIMRVRHGTAQVCGVGMPNQPVRLDSLDATGASSASATGWTDRQGRFDLRMAAADGTPGSLEDGHQLTGTVGDAEMALTLGPLDVSVNPTGTLVAQVMPDALLKLLMPAADCQEDWDDEALRAEPVDGITLGRRANSEGRFEDTFSKTRRANGITVIVYSPSGHSYMGTYFPSPLGKAYVDDNRVDGIASPGTRVAVWLEDAAGVPLGKGEAVAELDDGSFNVTLADPAGAPVIVQAGQRVIIETEGGLSAFTVEPLAFDYSPASGLAVTALPDRRLKVRFAIGSRVETLDEATDADGRFAFRPDEVPPRAGWTLDEVTGIEVIMPQPDGNATSSAWTADAGSDWWTVWLPWGWR